MYRAGIFILLLLIGTGAYSCVQDESVPPPDEQLVLLLVDLHLAEAASQNLTADLRDSLLPEYYSQAFRIHGYTEAAFYERMEILQRRPLEARSIYLQVDSILERRSLETRER